MADRSTPTSGTCRLLGLETFRLALMVSKMHVFLLVRMLTPMTQTSHQSGVLSMLHYHGCLLGSF